VHTYSPVDALTQDPSPAPRPTTAETEREASARLRYLYEQIGAQLDRLDPQSAVRAARMAAAQIDQLADALALRSHRSEA
jgi:hypothetical protein